MKHFLARGACVAACITAVTSIPAQAQEATAPSSRCELHIWPTARLEGVPYRVGVIQGRASDDQIEGAMHDLLTPTAQLAALRDADVVGALGLPAGTAIVTHEEPLDRKTVKKIKTRRAQSASPCYSELIMVQHALTEDIVWGDRFLTDYLFRNFGDQAKPQLSVTGRGGNKLKILTLSEATRPVDSPQLVAAALLGNFLEFAKSSSARRRASSTPRR